MKNLLIFNPLHTFPLQQGSSRRTWNLVNEIRKNNYRIHMVYYGAYKNNKSTYLKLEQYFDSLTIIEKNIEFKRRNGKNYYIDDLYEEGLGEQVATICKNLEIDIVLCSYVFHSKVLDYLPKNIYKVIDTIDIFTDKYKTEDWYSFSAEDEAKGLDRADLVIAIQDQEKKYFEKISKSQVITIKHIDEPKFIVKNYKEPKIIGILSSGHKQDLLAMQIFLKEFKKFIAKYPSYDIQLHIGGKICDKLSPSEVNSDKIKLLYLVDDLDVFYKSLDIVCSIPLDGTGIKIKTIEALSYGLPLLATQCASEGIDSTSKFHQCSTIQEMFLRLEDLICNKITLQQLSQLSKELFLTYVEKNNKNLQSIFPYIKPKQNPTYNTVLSLYRDLELTKAKDGFGIGTEKQNSYKKLFYQIDLLATTPFVRYPFKKYKLYKSMLNTFNLNK
ncbi:glycosyltransferase [Aliarcobacter butzleri]|uniref:glycosyltransferase n=1 Tax=Aliarcobacter butzleri TaxID=28197 RepID=UPI0021B45975|nr:glycosyltransferase [Aliarcobacter butzleri]MCT7550941.1 glycosyltransferase [Aliarcobacter butzleri]MCT7559911.1 glycosyltransferase [Aliarcobacter butzleri]